MKRQCHYWNLQIYFLLLLWQLFWDFGLTIIVLNFHSTRLTTISLSLSIISSHSLPILFIPFYQLLLTILLILQNSIFFLLENLPFHFSHSDFIHYKGHSPIFIFYIDLLYYIVFYLFSSLIQFDHYLPTFVVFLIILFTT